MDTGCTLGGPILCRPRTWMNFLLSVKFRTCEKKNLGSIEWRAKITGPRWGSRLGGPTEILLPGTPPYQNRRPRGEAFHVCSLFRDNNPAREPPGIWAGRKNEKSAALSRLVARGCLRLDAASPDCTAACETWRACRGAKTASAVSVAACSL
jgi:hypothetical protein